MLHLPKRSFARAGEKDSHRATGLVDSRRKGTNAAAAAAALADEQVDISNGHRNRGANSKNSASDQRGREGNNPSATDTTSNRNADADEGEASGSPAGMGYRHANGRSPPKSSSVPRPLSQVPSSPPAAAAAAAAATAASVSAATKAVAQGDALSFEDPNGALLTATTACQRRGRAQKKRARKIKDRARQLCLDVCTSTTTAEALTPWPRLDRAAKSLAELVRAKAQLAESKAVVPAARPPADAAASRLKLAGGGGGGAGDAGDSPSLAGTAGAPGMVLLREDHQKDDNQPGVGNGHANGAETPATVVRAGSGTTTVEIGNGRKGRTAALAEEAAAGGSSRSSGSDGGASGYSSSGAEQPSAGTGSGPFPTHRKTRRGKRAGGVINRRRGAKARSAASVLAAAAAASAGHLEPSLGAVHVAGAVGKDVGGGRGGKPGAVAGEDRPAVGTGETDALADVASSGAIARPQQLGCPTPSVDEKSSMAVNRDGHEGRDTGAREETPGPPAPAVRPGPKIDCACGSDGNAEDACASVADGAAVAVDGGPPPGKCWLSPHPPSLLARNVAASESAAWTSLLDLRGMCPPVSFSASYSWSCAVSLVESSSAPAAPRGPSTAAAVGDRTTAASAASATAGVRSGAAHKLHSQMKARGILDSLVVICAPFPWTPVAPWEDAESKVGDAKQRSRRSSAPAAAVGVDTTRDIGTRTSPPPSCTPSNNEPEGSPACADQSIAAHAVRGATTSGGSVVGDAGSGGGREAMTEAALDTLLAALVDSPSNQEHVLRIDGGAALVSGPRVYLRKKTVVNLR